MSAINASGWRPSAPVAGGGAVATSTGNKALMLEEPLIFEIGDTSTTGVDFDTFLPELGSGRGTAGEAGGGGVAGGAGGLRPPPLHHSPSTSGPPPRDKLGED